VLTLASSRSTSVLPLSLNGQSKSRTSQHLFGSTVLVRRKSSHSPLCRCPTNSHPFPSYLLWLHSHCTASGMVFAINPTAEKTFDTFKATAMGKSPNATTTGAPSGSSTPSPTPSSGALGNSVQKMTVLIAGAVFVGGLTL